MAQEVLLGLFDNLEATTAVLRDLERQNIPDRNIEVMSNVPYAPKVLGRRPTRQWPFLPFVLAGVLGGLAIALFIVVITPRLYPIIVGGQPLTPFPPSAIIVFEFVALGAMAGGFIGFLLQNRYPVLVRQMYDPRISEGYIGVAVRADDQAADSVADIFAAHNAHDVVREDAARYPVQSRRFLAFWAGLAVVGLLALLAPLLLTYNIIDIPWFNQMRESPSIGFQEGPRRAAPAESIPIQGPVLINGQPATEPLPASEESLQRGQLLSEVNCAICHGMQGNADGSMTKYFPEAPVLTTDRVSGMADQEIIMIITLGRNRMPSLAENLTVNETWDVVNYVRALREAGQ
jgi:mono/diheme cytochrome c family protein